MHIAGTARFPTTTSLVATLALFAMPVPPSEEIPRSPERAAPPSDACAELREWAGTNVACADVERYVSAADPSMTADDLWDAYDRLALAHLDAVGASNADAWIQASPQGIAIGGRSSANELVIVWSDPVYLAGARASLFTRNQDGRWVVAARQDLDVGGQRVSVEWSSHGVFLIGAVFNGADASWLSLVGLDARGSRLEAKPIVTHLWAGEERQTRDGVVVRTIVAPKHFITHLFENWREQEVTVEWTGQRFRTMRRETTPVIAALDHYCATRPSCAKATLQDIEYLSERRARAIYTSMSNHCEYGKPAVAVELAKTDRWRVVGLTCTTEP